ncbi:hypothetical protein BDW66DRAFT_160219 [Aspergillus desertorum]
MSTGRGQSRKRPLHLPAIAPKDDVTPLSRYGGSSTAVRATIIQPRLRFPPRSRTGCCRKIKCDEVHPQCNQCARLGHVCDYQPRLCFRDDTRRVMERMPDVKTKGNVVWDPAKTSPRRERIATSGSNPLLPDFSRLTSDEDREKKAQGSAPGTYHVIVVPESFARLPEYTGDALETVPSNPYSSPLSEYSSYDPMDEVITSEDPNVVILNQFRDRRKQVYPSRRSYTQSPESDLGSTSGPATMMYTPLQDISRDHIPESVDLETYGMALLDHFQNAVWMQLIPGGHGYMEASIFEQEASNFPPLLHVMMAVSALSLVRQGNVHYTDALQYYDHALPPLQSSLQNCDDVLSDGLFLTHFLLLVYQIALTFSSDGSNLWSYHMSRLLRLSLLRHSVAGRERYPLIICRSGEYIRAAIGSHLLPGAEAFLYPGEVEDNRMKYPGESVTQPLVTSLFTETRASKVPCIETMYRDLVSLRGELRQLWNSQEVRFLMETLPNLSKQSQHIFHRLSVLFHTSLLFSCSIFQHGQGMTHWAGLEREIQHHTEAILQLAPQMVGHGRQRGPSIPHLSTLLIWRYYNVKRGRDGGLEAAGKSQGDRFGCQAAMTSSILQVVCEAQLQHSRSGGYSREADWMEVAVNRGYRLVSYG